ncbi:MAG: hypothetical protein ACFCVH_18620 [Alphaproteobacteria bacterium]
MSSRVTSNPPAFVAYHVSDQGRGRKFWTRLGGVWPHKSGEGMTVFVNVLPIDFDGRIVLMPPKEQDEDGRAEASTDTRGEATDEEIPF